MIYTLVIVACLGLSDCKTYEVTAWNLPELPTAQYIEAQQRVAQWASEHPGKRVKGFKIVKGTAS